MTGPNGHAQDHGAPTSGALPTASVMPAMPQFSSERVKELVAALEVPFDAWQIEWRVTNATKNGQPIRGQVVPYADQRAYTDRLNALFTPAGWTRKYSIHTSANFERCKDQKIVAKVMVTCEVTVFGLGSHSATGEEWADDDNAVTSAEAQSFKRAWLVSGSAGIFIISPERGWTWTNTNDPKQFRNSLDGQHRRVGCMGFGPVAQIRKSHQTSEMQRALAAKEGDRTGMRILSERLSKWRP